ncbi:MAG: hypothetical protein K2Y12_02525 [Chitinophagaceae bacterium]|nr:hypothetical protein [Chitinophagaceae bacterium]
MYRIESIIEIILVTISVFLPVFFLIGLLFSYYKQLQKQQQLKNEFEKELLKVEAEVKEKTLQILAIEIHDNVGQILSLAKATLGSITLSNVESTNSKILNAQQLIEKSLNDLRQISRTLQGQDILEKGIEDAVIKEIDYLKREYNIHIEFEFDSKINLYKEPQKELFVFRIMQEAISNIIKHSEATSVIIQFKLINGILNIKLIDNGKGFSDSLVSNTGLGINNMRKRASYLNGHLSIKSELEKGTSIEINIPHATT